MRSERLIPLLALLAACELESIDIPRTEQLIAMHGVLSVSASTQVVLLEKTRNGSVSILGAGFDVVDPVIGDEGIAESGASVRLTLPSGQTIFAIEDNLTRNDKKGHGIYRFALPGSSLERGKTYRLTVTTFKGATLSAETSVPGGVAAMTAEQRVFDRSRDTLFLSWPATPGARSYFVRIETPFGPWSFFTDSTRLRLTGEVRNIDEETLTHLFIPGFPQAVTVSAVDSNYYDWYRSHNNTLTGTGLVSRVNGGLGVFGSLVRLRYQDLSVVVPQVEPATGRFDFVGTPLEVAGAPYLGLNLYHESRAARGDQGDALSGQYYVRPVFGYTGCLTCGVLGTVQDSHVELALLTDWFASDTADVFTGDIRGDTIVGRYRIRGGIQKFVKRK